MVNSNLKRTLIHGLEHGVKVKLLNGYNTDHEVIGIAPKGVLLKGIDEVIHLKNISPYLHPLSDLTKEIEIEGEKFVPFEVLQSMNFGWVRILDGKLCCDVYNGMDLSDMILFTEQLRMWMFNVDNLSPDEFIEVNETNNPYR